MSKIIRYTKRLPSSVNHFGYRVTLIKLCIDIALQLHIPIPQNWRWRAAHQFHTQWKLQQQNYYGIDEYNKRIDEKSREVLNDFYNVGTDFMHKTVVDIGCGTRGILPVIKASVKIGIDPTIGKVSKYFKFPEGIVYISEKAEEISLADKTVDVVSCNNALNHFENPNVALAQIHRILKPGGFLLLEVFIEKENIAHTVRFSPQELFKMTSKYFTAINTKYEQLKVKVEIDEELDGALPYRWGGVFRK